MRIVHSYAKYFFPSRHDVPIGNRIMSDTSPNERAPAKSLEMNGTVVLRKPDVPLFLCDLVDFVETGMSCVSHVPNNEWAVPGKWADEFKNGVVFQADIVFDPYIPWLHLSVEIRSALMVTVDCFKLETAFLGMDEDLVHIVRDAAEKIRAEKQRQVAAPTGDAQLSRKVSLLGEILSRTSSLPQASIERAVTSAAECGLKLGEFLVRQGLVTPQQVLEARSAQTGLAYADFDVGSIADDLLNIIPIDHLKRLACVPVALNAETVRIACVNPISKSELDALEKICGKRVELVLCPEKLLTRFFAGIQKGDIQKRRSHTRFDVSMPTTFRTSPADGPLQFGAAVSGRVIDVSMRGMQLIAPATIQRDSSALPPEQVKMLVTIDAGANKIIAFCEARHLRYTQNDKGRSDCVYGLKIEAILKDENDVLQNP